jgi:hypothetical protein
MKATTEQLKADYEREYTRTSGKTITVFKKGGWWILSGGLFGEHKRREKDLIECLNRLKFRSDFSSASKEQYLLASKGQ